MRLISATIVCPECAREFHQIDTTREVALAVVEEALSRHITAEHPAEGGAS